MAETFDNKQREYWRNIKERKSPLDPVVVAFARPKVDLIAGAVALPPGSTVLEAGCGNGYFTVQLAALWKTTGLDSSEAMLAMNPHTDVVLGDASAMPFEDASFDLVLCTNLLHHIWDPAAPLREMGRVSRRYLALVEPNRTNPAMLAFSLLKRSEHGALKFSLAYLEGLVRQCGLKILLSCSQGSITPNLTPRLMLPLLRHLNGPMPLGLYNIVVAEKLPS